MKKNKLETFIKKYYLGGYIEKLMLTSDGSELSTTCVSDAGNAAGHICGSKFDFKKFKVGINDTSKLKSLLSVLSEDIDLEIVNNDDDEPVSLKLSDGKSDINFMLSDSVANIKTFEIPKDADVEIKITEDFVSRFIKAQSALPEVESFSLLLDKKNKLKFVLGYVENINSNCVTLEVETVNGKDTIEPTHFPSKYLKEILLANSEMGESVLRIKKSKNQTVASISFKNDELTCDYMILNIKMC